MHGPTCSILALLALGALVGCRSSAEPTVAADDSLFVHTMADLRRIRANPDLDSAARDSAREAVLRAHDVSAEQLEAMARELARDPKRALDDWREIERLEVRARDSARSSRAEEAADRPR